MEFTEIFGLLDCAETAKPIQSTSVAVYNLGKGDGVERYLIGLHYSLSENLRVVFGCYAAISLNNETPPIVFNNSKISDGGYVVKIHQGDEVTTFDHSGEIKAFFDLVPGLDPRKSTHLLYDVMAREANKIKPDIQETLAKSFAILELTKLWVREKPGSERFFMGDAKNLVPIEKFIDDVKKEIELVIGEGMVQFDFIKPSSNTVNLKANSSTATSLADLDKTNTLKN